MSTVQPFDFAGHSVRTIVIDGEPHFFLGDTCAVLDIANVGNVAARLNEADIRTVDVWSETAGRTYPRKAVNESGLYDLILDSRKPEAKTFRRWVTSEVLPAIRKTGTYSTTPALTEDEIVHQALQITAAKVEALTARVAELEQPARAWDHLASASGDYSVNEAAKTLSRDHSVLTGERRLFAQMQKWGWIYRQGGDWRPYQAQVDNGRLATRARSHHHPRTGELIADAPQIRVTTKGLGEMLRLLTEAAS